MTHSSGISDRDRVLDATDLVGVIGEHVVLRPKGREHVGICPFHEDHSPSMAVVTHKGTAFYKCFACGASGTALDFMMNFHRMSFPEALRALAERAGIELSGPQRRDGDEASPRERVLKANAAAARWFRRRLLDAEEGAEARAILGERGIGEPVSERFELGVAPNAWDALTSRIGDLDRHARQGGEKPLGVETFVTAGLLKHRREGDGVYDAFRNRLIFPIHDEMGRPIAFGARKIDPDDEPKYLNSPESPVFEKSRTLYGMHLARRAIIESKVAIVTEGYTDVIACHQGGFENAVATLGTAFTREHARRLLRLCDTVILLFDGDEAGRRAADRALEVLIAEPIDIKIAMLPEGEDPDALLRTDEGVARFRAVLDGADDALAHVVAGLRERLADAGGVSARQRVVETLLDRLASAGLADAAPVRRQLLLGAIAALVQVPESHLGDELERRRPRRASTARAVIEPAAPSDSQDDASDAARRAGPTMPVEDDAPPSTRRRVEAERSLVAVLLAEPSLGEVAVDAGEGHRLPLVEVLGPGLLRSRSTRLLGMVLAERVEQELGVELQHVVASLGERDESAAARDATDLYLLGLELLRNAEDAPPIYVERLFADLSTVARLDADRERALVDTTDGDPAARLEDRLRQLRERGADATAVPRLPRSPRPVVPRRDRRSDRSDRRRA